MYKFFRKYQRFFIIFIAGVIIVVFTFFGTYNRGVRFYKERDKKIGKSFDKRDIFLSEIEKISFFLSFEEAFFSKTTLQELIEIGIAKELFKKYFEVLKGDFESRFKRVKNYTPYVHPQISLISAKNVWKRYNLSTKELLEKLQKKEKFDVDAFELLLKLYLEQKKFSPNSLKQVLLFEERQYKAMQDVGLFRDDLFLFGFSNIFDWFGKNFIDLVSQFIINGSRLAENQVGAVNFNEARLELLKKVGKRKILQKNEKTLVAIFQKVYTFQKYLNFISDNVFVDNLCHNEIFSFFSEKAKIKLFSLPSYLRFKSSDEFYKFLFYLKKTKKEFSPFLLHSHKSVEELEKEVPEFLERKFVLGIKKVNKSDIGLRIGERKLWDWQVEDANFEKLRNKFFELSSKECGKTKEDRFFLLEGLDGKKRAVIDEYSRNQMVEISEIKKEMEGKEKEKLEVVLKSSDNKIFQEDAILEGVNNERLFSCLKKNDSKGLLFYTDDDRNYYSISIQERSKKFLASFKKVKEDGSLDFLFNEFLYKKYLESKELEEVKGREFFEVRDFLGFLAFFDILEKMEKNPKEENVKSYASNFLLSYMERLRKDLLDEKILESNLVDEKKMEITRKTPIEWIKKEIFIEKPPLFSKVNVDGEKISFFKLIEKEKLNKAPFEEIEKAKKLLGREAKFDFLKGVVSDLKKENILIPIEY
jgi:hypothetical protein